MASKVLRAYHYLHMAMKLRKYLISPSLQALYYSFVYPLLLYGNIIWGNCAKKYLWSVYKIQKWAVRIISSTNKRVSSTPIYKKLGILKLPDLFTYSASLFMYKFNEGKLPRVFDKFFTKNAEIHGRSTRSSDNYRIPLTKNKLGEDFIYHWRIFFIFFISTNNMHMSSQEQIQEDDILTDIFFLCYI